MGTVSRLNKDKSIKIPEEILKKAGLKPGDEIIWLYSEETGQVLIMEKPDNFAKTLKGLGKEMWSEVDTNAYIKGNGTIFRK